MAASSGRPPRRPPARRSDARRGQQAAFFQREGTPTGDLPDLNRFIDARFAEAAVRQIGAR